MQEKEGNEGRKTDNHEEWTQCYIGNMLGLRYQDVQDRRRKRKSQSKEGRCKGKAQEGQESQEIKRKPWSQRLINTIHAQTSSTIDKVRLEELKS